MFQESKRIKVLLFLHGEMQNLAAGAGLGPRVSLRLGQALPHQSSRMDDACKGVPALNHPIKSGLNHPIQATLAVAVHRKVYGFLSPVAKATTEGLSRGGSPGSPKCH